MNTIEEKIWNYVDGTCTEAEKQAMARLIQEDEVYQRKYQEILAFNQELAAMELDEPSLGFTYKVMETIRAEEASKPLKAAIDLRIIKGIAAFFIITISVLVVYAMATAHWSSGGDVPIPVEIKLPSLKNYFSGPAMQGFLFFDVVLALFLFDAYLRRRNSYKNA